MNTTATLAPTNSSHHFQVRTQPRPPMRSAAAVQAGITVLSALPVAIVVAMLTGNEGIAIHLVLAAGFGLLAASLFAFRIAKPITLLGAFGLGGLAAIFLIQGISEAVPSDALHSIAFDVLGQWPEMALLMPFVLWSYVLLFSEAGSKTRSFGLVATTLEAAVAIATLAGVAPDPVKVLLLPPFIWMICEGKKRVAT